MNYIQGHTRGTTLGTRGTGESGFDPVELWVMGPPCGLKVEGAVTSCSVMTARHVREYPVSYVGNTLVPRARDEENHFPAR